MLKPKHSPIAVFKPSLLTQDTREESSLKYFSQVLTNKVDLAADYSLRIQGDSIARTDHDLRFDVSVSLGLMAHENVTMRGGVRKESTQHLLAKKRRQEVYTRSRAGCFLCQKRRTKYNESRLFCKSFLCALIRYLANIR
jgi:hypothetical protein